MKKLFIFTVTVLAMLGCGSSNGEKYSVTDDGNGTKSPRIVKTLEESFSDGNLTNSFEYNYTYNSQNLLVKEEGNDGTTISYTYNKEKQLIDRAWSFVGGGMAYSNTHYNYSHTIFMQEQNLPVLESRIEKSTTMFQAYETGKRDYTYELDENGRAIKLTSYELQITGPGHNLEAYSSTNYQYDSENRLIGIIDENGDETVLNYTKFDALASKISSRSKTIYVYNKNHLLQAKEYYHKAENAEWELTGKTTYFYENKPYYKAPSLLYDE